MDTTTYGYFKILQRIETDLINILPTWINNIEFFDNVSNNINNFIQIKQYNYLIELEKYLLNNPHRVTLTFKPDENLDERKVKSEADRLDKRNPAHYKITKHNEIEDFRARDFMYPPNNDTV